MKKRMMNVLLMGALVFTSAGFVSCGYDDDDLKTRLDVVEGKLQEVAQQISDLQKRGIGVTSASMSGDILTLVLSDGTSVEINTKGGGGGAAVSVEETDEAFIITVGDQKYTLNKGAAAAQLIYSPQYTDGQEVYTGSILQVRFLMSPVLATVDGAEIEVKEAHELKTRASSLFAVEGQAAIEGDFLIVPIQATAAESGKTYALSVRVKSGSKEYVSNYFNVQVGANDFKVEDLQDYGFAAVVTDAVKGEVTQNAQGDDTWTWKATLPNDLNDDFSFASYFTGVPEGAVYELAAQDQQVGNAAGGAYEVLRSSLKADGTFELSGRPGCAFPDGFLVNIKKDGSVKMKVNFVFNDPLADVDFKGPGNKGSHLEIYGATNDGSDILKAGANDIDLQRLFSKAKDDNSLIPLMHDGGAFVNDLFPNYEVTLNNQGDIVSYDGIHYKAGELGARYAKHSKGVWLTSHQISIASSNRRNLSDRPGDEGSDDNIAWCGGNCNGEIIGGYDGIPGEDRVAFGIDVTEDGHLVTTANYLGWAMRAGIWIKFEYDYGEKEIGGGAVAWVWCNRRSCPEGVQDPASR